MIMQAQTVHATRRRETNANTTWIAWMASVLLALAPWVAPARAQAGPEGNAHPETRAVNEGASGDPFGAAELERTGASASVEDKAAFARALNLAPLRGLAVLHNGRVKILDTLARESVERITGRRRYEEVWVPSGAGQSVSVKDVKTFKFDPLFTLLDVTIDPRHYVERPLLGVGYLPLRKELVEKEFPQGGLTAEVWLRSGRVSPAMAAKWAPVMQELHMGEPAFAEALQRLDVAMGLFIEGRANFAMVAPDRRDVEWAHLATLAEDHPARAAALDLGRAWRAMDAAATNSAIATLAQELPKINPEVYPDARRSLELRYNNLRAFEWGWVLYALSLVTLLLAFGTGRRTLAWLGGALLVGGAGLHAVGFVARCIIAERFAIQNQFESMTGLSLFAVLVALAIMAARRQWLFGAAAAAVGFMVLVTATQMAIPGQFVEREAAILNTSVLLKYHVTTVLVSYGLIALGMVVSLFYLGTHYLSAPTSGAGTVAVGASPQGAREIVAAALGEDGSTPQPGTIHKTLADLDTAQMIVLQLAFWTLGVGILLGAWWADHSWGRWWAFDPKETWALITWIVYLIVIHVRLASPRNKGLTTAWLSVVGFVIMLWTYFGVNLLLPGLHAYA
jgi:cytochrome c-type biogenesis protein CcsB